MSLIEATLWDADDPVWIGASSYDATPTVPSTLLENVLADTVTLRATIARHESYIHYLRAMLNEARLTLLRLDAQWYHCQQCHASKGEDHQERCQLGSLIDWIEDTVNMALPTVLNDLAEDTESCQSCEETEDDWWDAEEDA